MSWAVCLVAVCLLGDSPPATVAPPPPAAASITTATAPTAPTATLDTVVAAEQAAAGVTPEALADDVTFLRRAWLDLAGRTPPAADVEKFLSDSQPDKRARLVDQLLVSDEFANHWGRVWTEYLTDQRPFSEEGYRAVVLQAWLRETFRTGRSYRQTVRELLTGAGASDESGPANFLLRYNVEPVQLAGAVSKKFLGLTIQCAQCHNHPLAKWHKDDFWGLAAYFGRLRRMEPNGDNDDPFSMVVERTRGELQVVDSEAKPDEGGEMPRKATYPRLPGSRFVEIAPLRREALADWVTSDQNPYFARHATNLVWKQLFGSPLAGSFDQYPDEPATPRKAVLDHLTAEFLAHKTDLKSLIRTIVLSQTYQRGSGTRAVVAMKPDEDLGPRRVKQLELFGRFPVRPLSSDALYLSVVQATGYRGSEEAARLATTTKEDFDNDTPNDTFAAEPLSVHRALSLLNGDYLRDASSVAVQEAIRKHGQAPGVEHVRHLFLTIVSRPPTLEEVEQFLDLASSGEDGLQDATWVLLNSAEFCSNH